MTMMLIDHGAMVDKADIDGWTPLFAAAQVGSDSFFCNAIMFKFDVY